MVSCLAELQILRGAPSGAHTSAMSSRVPIAVFFSALCDGS